MQLEKYAKLAYYIHCLGFSRDVIIYTEKVRLSKSQRLALKNCNTGTKSLFRQACISILTWETCLFLGGGSST